MLIKVLKTGYYDDKRVREGQEIVLKSKEHFSAKWMEKLESAPKKVAKKKEVKELAEDFDDNKLVI